MLYLIGEVQLNQKKIGRVKKMRTSHDTGPLYKMALEQFGKAADLMGLDPNIRRYLERPQRNSRIPCCYG